MIRVWWHVAVPALQHTGFLLHCVNFFPLQNWFFHDKIQAARSHHTDSIKMYITTFFLLPNIFSMSFPWVFWHFSQIPWVFQAWKIKLPFSRFSMTRRNPEHSLISLKNVYSSIKYEVIIKRTTYQVNISPWNCSDCVKTTSLSLIIKTNNRGYIPVGTG